MKWMIASDIHGSAYYCRRLIEALFLKGCLILSVAKQRRHYLLCSARYISGIYNTVYNRISVGVNYSLFNCFYTYYLSRLSGCKYTNGAYSAVKVQHCFISA